MFERMANILHDLTYDDLGLFSDMKITNWMVDEQNNLRISDTKSLCFSNHYDETENIIEIQKSSSLVYSTHMVAPELADAHPETASIDKIHSYLLGKVLYQFLTGCNDDDVSSYSAVDFDFNYPIFQLPTGKLLQHLITSLVSLNPQSRPSTNDVIQYIQFMTLQLSCYQLIDRVSRYALSNTDHGIQNFIRFILKPPLLLVQIIECLSAR